jgi:hypothetical protein
MNAAIGSKTHTTLHILFDFLPLFLWVCHTECRLLALANSLVRLRGWPLPT